MLIIENKWFGLLFWPLSVVYRGIIFIRNKCYDYQLFKSHRVNCPVISVGNIHIGGTGKTPTVLFLAQWFRDKGYKVAILSRGYRRKGSSSLAVSDEKQILADAKMAGDEPMLLAKRLPGVPVWVDADRVRGSKALVTTFHPDIILLDDGFQHRRLARDVDIVTFKKMPGINQAFLLPAGPLREPFSQLHRAHLLWINGNSDGNDILPFKINAIPCIFADYRVSTVYNRFGDKNPLEFKGTTAVAFCGLANPNSFYHTIRSLGIHIHHMLTFRDHHHYKPNDVQKILSLHRKTAADIILTTEKDWIKLDEFPLDDKWHCLAITIVPRNPQEVELFMENICRKLKLKKSVSI